MENINIESHKFWRLYGGFKFSYLHLFTDADSKIVVLNNKDFKKILYAFIFQRVIIQ
jgi:hypothetical protein